MDEYSTMKLPLTTGSSIGDYDIEAEIGSHPLIAPIHVYRAFDKRVKRRVAIKIFTLNTQPAFASYQARFLREIDLMKQMDHPHILPILADGHNEQLLWIVMPYCGLGTLADFMEQRHHAALTVSQACDYAIQMCEALHAAHTQWPPIIHRDVKPQNMLFADDRSLLLADFGIAHIMFGPHLTENNLVIGTPRYMAPEQLYPHGDMTSEHIDPRVDIYAIGCVLYEMLSGAPLLENMTPQAMALAHLYYSFRPLNERNSSVSHGLALIVQRAMHKNPGQRFPTAHAFAEALEPFVHAIPGG
jgi:eukaryotic-like serine/threonine-protein kinase